jgi:myosin protein heavy chain
LTRTATEYSTIIQAKEEDFARIVAELRNMKQDREKTLSHTAELQGRIGTLTAELDVQKSDWKRSASTQAKLQEELDELRTLLHAKTSEENRRSEVEKSKDEELTDLRRRVVHLQHDLSDARKSALEGQSKLKVDLENVVREHGSLQQSHRTLIERELACRNQLAEAKTSLSELEKSKRALESELRSLRSQQHDSEGQLVEMKRANEVWLPWHNPVPHSPTCS